MKLSDETKSVLKNYANINNSIHIVPGNVLETISPALSLYARYESQEKFENTITIYDLQKFLGAISLFNDPDLDFGDKFVSLNEGKQRIKFAYADPSTIIKAPDNIWGLPSEDVIFDITASQFQNVMKSIAILGLQEVSVVGKDGLVYIQSTNNDDPTSNSYRIEVGTSEFEFNAIFNANNLMFINKDYNVTISKKKLARFVGGGLTYYIPAEAKSKF